MFQLQFMIEKRPIWHYPRHSTMSQFRSIASQSPKCASGTDELKRKDEILWDFCWNLDHWQTFACIIKPLTLRPVLCEKDRIIVPLTIFQFFKFLQIDKISTNRPLMPSGPLVGARTTEENFQEFSSNRILWLVTTNRNGLTAHVV